MSDPYFDNVTLLLHCDGSDGSTTFTDVKGHTVTPAGNAQIDTAQSKFGGASALFDGSGDTLTLADSSDWDLPGDFTAECWIRYSSEAGGGVLELASGTMEIVITSNLIAARIGSSTYTKTGTNNDSLWHHVALVRSSGVVSLYVDGTYANGASYSTSIAPTTLRIGNSAALYGYYSGWIDDIRITKGVARYTADFTPPTAAFPDSAGATTYTKTLSAGAYLSEASTASTETVSAGSVIQRNMRPVCYAGASLSKAGLTKTSLIGAALKATLTKTADAGACIGAIMTQVAYATAAELGVEKTVSASSDFMVAGREYMFAGSLLQKTLTKQASSNGYVTQQGLLKTLTAGALFNTVKRVYASSAVYGTATKSVSSGAVMQDTDIGITVTAGALIATDSTSTTYTTIPVLSGSLLQKATGLTATVSATIARQRASAVSSNAYIGSAETVTSAAGSVLAKTRTKTATSGSVVSKVMTKTPLVGAALYAAGLTKTVVAGAYLVADAGTETLVRADCEWTAQPRQVEWMAASRETEWLVDARPVEWIASGCGENPQWAVTVRTACQAGAYLAAA